MILRSKTSRAESIAPSTRPRTRASHSTAPKPSLSAFVSEQTALTARVGEIAADLDARRDLVESLPGRLQNVETSLSAMQGIAAGSRSYWLRAEAEYYMQLANAQLQLGRNASLAAYGLELADERVRELADPSYTPVRRALAAEIQALRAMASTDKEGVSLRLAGLAGTVDALPLASTIEPSNARPAARDPGADASGFARAWAAVRNVAAGLVRVRQTDEQLAPLMSPEASYFLRTNLALKFDVARLALLRGEQDAYTRSLDDAADWVGEYFDMESDAVRSTLASIAELRDTDVMVQFPDISESLRLLRQRGALEELGGE